MVEISFIDVQSPPQPQRKKEKKTEYKIQETEVRKQQGKKSKP
jgi:hypothetical protein